MNITKTSLPGLAVVDTSSFSDNRGAFTRLFCTHELREIFGERNIVQINHSRTNAKGAIRGLHFQHPPHAEMKLIRCIRGRVWDVAVDLRAGSSTFMHWHAVELSADNVRMIVIPEGFAHGFQVMEEKSELIYLHTESYAPSSEAGLNPFDEAIAINWPIAVTDISERDKAHPLITSNFSGIVV